MVFDFFFLIVWKDVCVQLPYIGSYVGGYLISTVLN